MGLTAEKTRVLDLQMSCTIMDNLAQKHRVMSLIIWDKLSEATNFVPIETDQVSTDSEN